MVTTLDQITPGQEVTVFKVSRASESLSRALASFGLVVGSAIKVMRPAPFGDPIRIKSRNTEIVLRKVDASQIEVSLN